MDFTPTDEQAAIVQAALTTTDSLMVVSYAGCTKTTALKLVANALPPGPALALAFSVPTKKELERHFPAHITIMTLNGLGHRAWAKAVNKPLVVDDRKVGRLITRVAREESFDLSSEQWTAVRALVNSAQVNGLVPSSYPHKGLVADRPEIWMDMADMLMLPDAEPLLPLARATLVAAIQEAFQGTISYADQIYMSALFNGAFPRYPLVMVDEAQDLSPLNHVQIKRAALGRLIVVGDPKQAIYGWRGADHTSMDTLRTLRKDWTDLALTQTFRCPSEVVARQQVHAPGFTAAPKNPAGLVLEWHHQHTPWTWALVDQPRKTIGVLCRNNAPLLGLAMKLIRQGVGCVMAGRDIGKGLVALARKIVPVDSIPAEECKALINQWADDEIILAKANDKLEKVAGIEDRRDCLLVVLETGVADAGTLRNILTDLFSREAGRVTLSSIHRAKGLEWDIVVHLDPWRIPSKQARKAAQLGDQRPLQQELNLRYVCETRTKHTLILANLEDFT